MTSSKEDMDDLIVFVNDKLVFDREGFGAACWR